MKNNFNKEKQKMDRTNALLKTVNRSLRETKDALCELEDVNPNVANYLSNLIVKTFHETMAIQATTRMQMAANAIDIEFDNLIKKYSYN